MTLSEIEELRQKGWKFDFTGNGDGWNCVAVGRLAHGWAVGNTLEQAADGAMREAGAMEDDPNVLIGIHGPDLLKLAKKTFGQDVVKGIEPVESPELMEPVRIALSIEPKIDHEKYMEQEVVFIQEMMKNFPKQVYRAVILEVDWVEEKAK